VVLDDDSEEPDVLLAGVKVTSAVTVEVHVGETNTGAEGEDLDDFFVACHG
jgi:hypothetical protein